MAGMAENFAQIKVVGCGGGGSNAVNRMIGEGLAGRGVHRHQHRRASPDAVATRPSACGSATRSPADWARAAIPEEGRKAAEESQDEIREVLQGADMVFVTAGMGGGTGTGAAPVIARIAKEEIGALTIGVVTRPFTFEGAQAQSRGCGAGSRR